MILFCDTSALMKLYVDEAHSTDMRSSVKRANSTMVSLITWVEIQSAFSLKQRTGQVSPSDVEFGLARLRDEWANFTRISVDPELTETAGQFALAHGLRAYDGLQLASAWRAHQIIGGALRFCCFDRQLNAAATALGMQALEV